ncbi:hypothetical protein DTO166G4_5475 [Paecilomyces variotii]|nr:hypothetical protein DTO166G4_5475 [Paecilomyces variotii]KAJ9219045.1 hypothetical protein DTO169C6_8620 [Paecilomyces variotii]KAJ9236110.1 hypothetical protein DTO166G5_4155 [Paecilomyces variotii]KAJ9254776.1 hypothetical protein DTO195F2_6532 [Paecilomyces variotii]KAJ9286478.1 hypothetical protein DTO021C3_6012 [Paecilomyces variotii]
MLVPAALSLALVAGVSAQSTVTLFLPGFDTQSMVASVVGSDATATTYALGCAPDVDSEDCGVPPGFTIVQGASTMDYVMSIPSEYVSMGCKLESDVADCSVTFSPSPPYSHSNPAETTVSGISSYYQAVVVTTGAVTGAAATTGASPAANTASATAASASASSGFSTATSSKASSTSSASETAKHASSSTSTGGVPQMTGNASWMIGGAAVAFALAAM